MKPVAADVQTQPTDFNCESYCRPLLSSTFNIFIYYYYSAKDLILVYHHIGSQQLILNFHSIYFLSTYSCVSKL